MQQWISRREERGVFHQLIRELEVGDVVAYRELFRMTKEQFSFLLGKVSPLIQKKEQPSPINSVRATIQPDERLAVTLRYLATGETYHSLEYSFRISRQTISSIVSETSRALYKVSSSWNRWFIYIKASKSTYLTYILISYTTGTCSRISKSTKHRKWVGRSGRQIRGKMEFSECRYRRYRRKTCNRSAAF